MSISTRIRISLPITLAILCGTLSATTLAEEPGRGKAAVWSFDALAQQAQQRASRPFEPSPALPAELKKLDYDSYRLIEFEHAAAIWKGSRSPFALECFHRGYLFSEKVSLNLIEDGRPHPLPFDRRLFQYRGKLSDIVVPNDLGFAGFRVLGRFESSPHLLEIASFLGATYFRAIGEGQVYGTSARGLAVDIGMPKAEEFPVFRDFWIERPEPETDALRIWALLDSPSVAGAYQFNLRPGKDTVLDVKARLFFRRQPEKIGLAPMSSMWMWGDGRDPPVKDHRPAVHDCDGLLVRTNSDDWVWRPLSRQSYPSLSHFDFVGIRGFGLLQRNRRAESYLDNETKYDLRPSVWIEPKGEWLDGAIELLELPAQQESVDNIAAWWKPNKPVSAGIPIDLEYTVAFMAGEPEHAVARALTTRVTRRDGQPIKVEIDFRGGRLARLAADAAVACEVKALRGAVSNIGHERHADGSWRVRFDVRPAGREPVELRASLATKGKTLTETWRYLCPI
jgi:periplasmic glucans biosynthesis protein